MPWNVYFMYNMDSYIPILVINGVITTINGILNGELSFFTPYKTPEFCWGIPVTSTAWSWVGYPSIHFGLTGSCGLWAAHCNPQLVHWAVRPGNGDPRPNFQGGEFSHGKTMGTSGCFLIKWWVYTPKMIIFSRKTFMVVGETHHF